MPVADRSEALSCLRCCWSLGLPATPRPWRCAADGAPPRDPPGPRSLARLGLEPRRSNAPRGVAKNWDGFVLEKGVLEIWDWWLIYMEIGWDWISLTFVSYHDIMSSFTIIAAWISWELHESRSSSPNPGSNRQELGILLGYCGSCLGWTKMWFYQTN